MFGILEFLKHITEFVTAVGMLREKNPTIRNFINKFFKIIFPMQKVNDRTLDRVTELRAHYPIQHI